MIPVMRLTTYEQEGCHVSIQDCNRLASNKRSYSGNTSTGPKTSKPHASKVSIARCLPSQCVVAPNMHQIPVAVVSIMTLAID